MIAAIQDLAEEPNQETAKPTARFLEACNLIFEKGILSPRRINRLNSSVIFKILRKEWLSLRNGATVMKKQLVPFIIQHSVCNN